MINKMREDRKRIKHDFSELEKRNKERKRLFDDNLDEKRQITEQQHRRVSKRLDKFIVDRNKSQ